MERLFSVILAVLVSACTTVGLHDRNSLGAIDFGQKEVLRFCILADDSITESESRLLIAKVNDEFANYGLEVTVPWVRPWKRRSFTGEEILNDVINVPLEPPCDRLLALVGRNLGDFLWGLVGPEILGMVETASHTRGYIVAERVTLNQILSGPVDSVIHESYHLMGCVHDPSLTDCYHRIRDLKQEARANRDRGNDFFPGVSVGGEPITSRTQADDLVLLAFKRTRRVNNMLAP